MTEIQMPAAIDESKPALNKINGEPSKDTKNNGNDKYYRTVDADQLKSIEYIQILKDCRIRPEIDLPPPPVALELIQDSESIPICTLGNFSLIIGKAKSRKTFFLTMAMAAAVRNEYDIFRGCLPLDQNKVIYFDTEQSHYHALKTVRRVCQMTGNDIPDNFEAYGLRKFNPAERLELIRSAIERIEGIGLIVIDGIRDLVTSINDEQQSTETASNLLKWSEEKNIHIITILHQNKGDNNARGHLGSELTNKAETTISISKNADDDEMSIVEPEYTRDLPFRPFAFSIENDIPVLADWQPAVTKKPVSKLNPEEMAISTHREILTKIFAGMPQMKYSELHGRIKSGYGINLGDNKVRSYINYYKDCSLIIESGTAGTKHCNYSINTNFNDDFEL